MSLAEELFGLPEAGEYSARLRGIIEMLTGSIQAAEPHPCAACQKPMRGPICPWCGADWAAPAGDPIPIDQE